VTVAVDVTQPTLYADVFVPPDGTEFHTGVLLTHDLDCGALADVVAPALAAVDGDDPHRRRIEARARWADPATWLVVLAAADRVQPGPTIPWVHVEPITGRRQHAKLGLLLFADVGKPDVATVARAVVTSANLTRGGLGRNREVVLCEDTPLNKSGALSAAVASLLKRLAHHHSDPTLDLRIARIVKEVADHPKPSSKPVWLAQSITRIAPLLPKNIRGPARRVSIVSPAFAGAGSKAASTLDSYLGHGTKVDLYVGIDCLPGAQPANPPRVASALLDHLRSRAGTNNVRLMLVPEATTRDDGTLATRRLHAKLYAFEWDDGTTLVHTGSANFTDPGLRGDNREVLVQCAVPVHHLRDFLDDLQALPFTGRVQEPGIDDAPAGKLPARPALEPSIELSPWQEASALVWSGTLRLNLPAGRHTSQLPVRLVLNGRELNVVGEQEVQVAEGDCTLVVEWPDGTVTRLPIQIDAPGNFWKRIAGPDPVTDVHRDFLNALLDLRQAARSAKAKDTADDERGDEGATVTSGCGPRTDGFRIPLEQRLVLLARRRQQFAQHLSADYVDEQLAYWFDDPAEREVARTVAAAAAGFGATSPARDDPLLRRLVEALRSGKEGDER
jgi:hypothetical protein